MLKLANVIYKLNSENDVENFLLDILTPQEIKAMEMRWLIANLLKEGKLSYLEIAKKAKTSTTTVTRVKRFMINGNGGYYKALKEERHNG